MYFKEHLYTRGLRPWHNVWIDHEKELISFPIYTTNKKLIGYQRYNWQESSKRNNVGRYFTHITPEYRAVGCYGLEHINDYGPIFIVEGIWDCLRVRNCYYNCLAVLTNTPHKQLIWLINNIYYGRQIIVIQDNDKNKAGNKLASGFSSAIMVPDGYKDINEMEQDECSIWLCHKLSELRHNENTKNRGNIR